VTITKENEFLPAEVKNEPPSRFQEAMKQILGGSAMISVLAVVIALVVGAILIAATDPGVQAASGYFFSRPLDTLQAIWSATSGAYAALFQGSIYNFNATTFVEGIKPLTDTLWDSTSLIAAGLGVALSFRIGLFNIGGQGQILAAAACAGWIGFTVDLPFPLLLVLALAAGLFGGAIWAGLVGFLKARTGAHEVIVTIMLNYVAFYLISYLLKVPVLQAPGTSNPKAPPMKPAAIFPSLFGPPFSITIGFLLVIAATVFLWWLLNRSSLGFQFRAIGENPRAARTSGINVNRMYVYGMLISGALIGLAGANQVQGVITTGFSSGIDSGIGFSAITVALLGRSRPWGVFGAGILFGAFQAGGYTMQAAQNVPVDIVLVVQSVIVLFIAAPPLVRTIFHLPKPGAATRPRTPVTASAKKEIVTK
jgi:simple sugar transport system permease protein